jgi:hypothetical protein
MRSGDGDVREVGVLNVTEWNVVAVASDATARPVVSDGSGKDKDQRGYIGDFNDRARLQPRQSVRSRVYEATRPREASRPLGGVRTAPGVAE